jgi:outer membrane biosynthesis protein TonB
MRLAIQRYTAPLVAWIPDLSQVPARKRILIGIAASLLLHVVGILLVVLLTSLLPKVDVQAPEPRREIELTMIPDEPPPEPVLPLAPNPQRQFLDPTGLDISQVAPEKPDFESSENGVAASETPGKGDMPLPNQSGRDLPFMAFNTQRALFGPSPKPFPADPQETSLKTPPPAVNPPTEQDVALKPAPEPPPPPDKPEKPDKQTASATPAPAATPPPKSDEKTETPAVAQATPPPLKVVDKAKEDEIAISSKPPATPPPSTAQTEKPQPQPVPPPVEALTPRPVTRQVMLVTPAPRAQPPVQPPAQTSNQLEQEQNHLEGSISNRGRKAANTIATPLGKYRKQVIDAIGSRWQYYVKSHADVLALGSARVSFLVDSSGHVRAVRVENNTSNQSFADLCERAIREAEIPEPPPDAVAPMRDGHLEYSINFTLYSL